MMTDTTGEHQGLRSLMRVDRRFVTGIRDGDSYGRDLGPCHGAVGSEIVEVVRSSPMTAARSERKDTT